MRSRLSLLLALLAAAPPTSAQVPVAQRDWYLGGGVDAVRFGHVTVTEAAPDLDAELRPSGRAALHLAIGRWAGPWSLGAEAGWAGGQVEASTDAVTVRDLSSDVDRLRFALGIGRTVGAVGPGHAALELAPALDLWSVEGDTRTRLGAEARLVLRVPLGGVRLEHRIGLGLSGSPIEAADVGPATEERSLTWLTVGVGVRSGL